MSEQIPATPAYDDTPTAAAAAPAAPEWNPVSTIETVRVPLEVSGGRAAVLLRRWSGRQRLAYDDAVVTRALATDEAGLETVKFGSLGIIRTALTVVGSDGFPGVEDGFLAGDPAKVEADLLSITDLPTLREIITLAREHQPTSADTTADDAPAAGGEGDADPSRTPPTPQAETSDVATPASLDE